MNGVCFDIETSIVHELNEIYKKAKAENSDVLDMEKTKTLPEF